MLNRPKEDLRLCNQIYSHADGNEQCMPRVQSGTHRTSASCDRRSVAEGIGGNFGISGAQSRGIWCEVHVQTNVGYPQEGRAIKGKGAMGVMGVKGGFWMAFPALLPPSQRPLKLFVSHFVRRRIAVTIAISTLLRAVLCQTINQYVVAKHGVV